MVFNFVVLYEVIMTFVIRSSYQVPFFSNRWVWGAAGLAVALQALLMYTPLATVFKIVPLGMRHLGVLLVSGVLFALVAVFYMTMSTKRDSL